MRASYLHLILKLTAKKKNTTKSTQTWLNVWENRQMKENSTLNWRSMSTKISIRSYKCHKCFSLKYVPKMHSFIILLRILYTKNRMNASGFRDRWSLVMFLKFSNYTHLRLVQYFKTIKSAHMYCLIARFLWGIWDKYRK